MPFVSVVIITWNAQRYVKDCLDSVIKSLQGIVYEIIVIDNGSTDSTKDLLSSYKNKGTNINILFKDHNLGVAKARNVGLKQAQGKYIWILDIDTVVNQTVLSAMIDFMESNRKCGLCATKLISSEGNVQDSCRKLPSVRYKLNNFLEVVFAKTSFTRKWRKKIERANQSQFYRSLTEQNNPFEVEYVIGACQFIRKKALDETGLLDEKIFYGPEDADFCLRVAQKGWTINYLPYVTIIHEYQQITKKKLFSSISYKHAKALLYFFWKHKKF